MSVLSSCTIVSIEEVEKTQQSEAFDPAHVVEEIWESKVIPAISEKAANADLATVLTAIESNLSEAGNKYATVSQSGSLNFVVHGQGTVQTVDTESRNGKATLQIEGYQGKSAVILQIGPLVRGDSIRDGVGFIKFGDFKDQTEFGQVSKELNRRVSENVLAQLDLASLQGKQVTFDGVFTIRTTNQTNIDLSEVVITPVVLNVK
ncbi:MAG: DUF2291 domain-containing protein [Caldilineaceae bacterium]